MKIVTCPKCEIRVLPKANGTCPNCKQDILQKPNARTSSRRKTMSVSNSKVIGQDNTYNIDQDIKPKEGDKTNIEKQAFFDLEIGDQKRLRYFMAILYTSNIFGVLFIPSTTTYYVTTYYVCTAIGVGSSLLILFSSYFIEHAPRLYFRIIQYSLWFTIIFNGLDFSSAVSNQQFSSRNILNALCLVFAIAFIPTYLKYRSAIKKAKNLHTANHDSRRPTKD